MAESTWLFIEYGTAAHDTRFTVLPESALINSFGNFRPDRLLAAFQKYAAVLGKLTPTAIIAYEKLPESEARSLCDEVTLCYLIDAHDLTFSYSDDHRYWASGQASLDRVHRIVREDHTLPWFLWKLWNIKVNHGITPDHQSQWRLTPAQVATIAGNPSIKMDLINQEMATP